MSRRTNFGTPPPPPKATRAISVPVSSDAESLRNAVNESLREVGYMALHRSEFVRAAVALVLKSPEQVFSLRHDVPGSCDRIWRAEVPTWVAVELKRACLKHTGSRSYIPVVSSTISTVLGEYKLLTTFAAQVGLALTWCDNEVPTHEKWT